jgi:hypothetical protein
MAFRLPFLRILANQMKCSVFALRCAPSPVVAAVHVAAVGLGNSIRTTPAWHLVLLQRPSPPVSPWLQLPGLRRLLRQAQRGGPQAGCRGSPAACGGAQGCGHQPHRAVWEVAGRRSGHPPGRQARGQGAAPRSMNGAHARLVGGASRGGGGHVAHAGTSQCRNPQHSHRTPCVLTCALIQGRVGCGPSRIFEAFQHAVLVSLLALCSHDPKAESLHIWSGGNAYSIAASHAATHPCTLYAGLLLHSFLYSLLQEYGCKYRPVYRQPRRPETEQGYLDVGAI